MVESNALLKRRSPKGYRGFESLPHRLIGDVLVPTPHCDNPTNDAVAIMWRHDELHRRDPLPRTIRLRQHDNGAAILCQREREKAASQSEFGPHLRLGGDATRR